MASRIPAKVFFLTTSLLVIAEIMQASLVPNNSSQLLSLEGVQDIPFSVNIISNSSQLLSLAAVQNIPVSVNIISNIGMPGALLYNRESDSVIMMSYSLNCTSYDTVYRILVTTSAENVAKITGHGIFSISCSNLSGFNDSYEQTEGAGATETTEVHKKILDDEEPSFIGVLTGQVNMTVRAGDIGRAFLLVFANKLSGRGPQKMNIAGKSSRETPPWFAVSTTSGETYTTASGHSTVIEATKTGRLKGVPKLPPNVVGRALIIVMQLPRPIDEVFRVILYVVIVLATAGMGVKVDYLIIKQTMKKPVAPIIGLCCQYLGMPLIAYLVAKVVPQNSAAVSLGIFTCGIVPGGGQSNMFAYLLGGDISLSATMTTLSNIAALGLLPMWIFTLGETFKDDTIKLHVPFEKILEALAIAILPLFVGMFIRYKFPKVAHLIGKILKPVLIIIVVFLTTFGIYINVYIFEMIRPMTIVAGCLLPYIGYVLGGFISFLCCRTWTEIKTIAIETGIQNSTIAFMILYMSLPPPDNQLATVGPAASAIMTPLPLFVAVFFYILYQRLVVNKRNAKDSQEEDKHENGHVKKDGKAIAKALLRGEETAAIVLCWQKLTGRETKTDILEEMLNKELEVMAPEKDVTIFNQPS